MKRYLLPFLILAFAGQASGQLIYGSLKTWVCAGQSTLIQTASGFGTGFFRQVSMNNGTSWNTVSDNAL